MSRARKCDICGIFFERGHENKTYNRMTLQKIRDNGTINGTAEYDICQDCSERIMNLLDRRAVLRL